MKRIVTFEEFFSTVGLGLWQAFCYVCKAFDPRHKTKFWRVIWAVWTTMVVGFVVFACLVLWDDKCSSREYDSDKAWLSDDVYVQWVYRGDNYVYNTKTKKKTLKGLNYCCSPMGSDTLAVFFKDGKRGYFSVNTGEVLLPAVYERAWVFSEGVAMVVKGDSLRIIDGEGNMRGCFWYSRQVQRDEGIDYVFHDGVCKVNTQDGYYGLIDKSGAWVVPAEYEDIYREEYGADIVYKVTKEDTENGGYLYGAVDDAGNELIPCIYKTLKIDTEEGIFVTDAQHYQWKSDLYGNLGDEPLCYNVSHLEYTVKQATHQADDEYDYEETVDVTRFAPLYSYTSSEEGYMGLMDANGHRITPPVYRSIKAINDNLYCCGYDDQFDNAVLLNAKGAVVEY